MNDDRFDRLMDAIELEAKVIADRKAVVVEMLSYASQRRSKSIGQDKTEWHKETNRLDRIREACNLLEKALK